MNLTQCKEAADLLAWRNVPQLMLDYFEKCADVVTELRAADVTEPRYFNPETAELRNEPTPDEPWVKVSGSPVVAGMAEALNYFPNRVNNVIPGLQSPLGAALTSGLVGAGLGYAGGTALESLLPSTWKRKRLRRTLAMLGGLGLATPALAWGAANIHNGKSVLDGWPLDDGPHPPPVDITPKPVATGPFQRKVAEAFESETGIRQEPLINVDMFNRVIWFDPQVAGRLSPVMQAATSGLLTGAATLAGGGRQATFVTPWDVGRMAAGMGSGYLAGELIGKGLGALAGMPQATQDRLKQTGMFAGVVANLVPLAFRGSQGHGTT